MKGLFYLFIIISLHRCDKFSNTPNNNVKEPHIRLISYNVENLFDTWDDELTFDEDFTPTGSYYWSRTRYEKKIKDIGKVLMNASGSRIPAIIGLIEVENQKVLEDLLNKSPLSKFQYAIIHEDSPDERGIDVALFYDTEQFTFLEYQLLRIQFPKPITDKTRDILLVKGILARDTVYVGVNHWPSRRGGESISEPKRLFVANQLKRVTDSILENNPHTGIILMGDYNDTPQNKSISRSLGAGNWESNSVLVNLMTDFAKEGKGTYKYQNQWNMLDQFIVSRNLTDKNGTLLITRQSANIYDPKWLQEGDPVYPGDRIARTYRGPIYVGGYSDHYPIVLDLFFQ